ncbi:MAG: maleylpyruvate isomerase family mycothiol-dependent enzyme [Acidimicrobiia bacterium]|nr:maleylpyruvate isomerase family mycothiol-dependent enzyme [Acidimicrobiia bacterium]
MQRTAALAALAREYDELLGLADDLTAADWDAPSLRGDWSCRDVFAHVTSVDEAITRGNALLWGLPRYSGRAARAARVAAWRGRSIPELRGRTEERGRRLHAMLWAASRATWKQALPTPFGRHPLESLVAYRTHDLWIHNRDIAVALDRSVADPRRTAPSLTWLLALLPRRLGPALGEHAGRSVTVYVTGWVAAAFTWQVASRRLERIPDDRAWSEASVSDVRITVDTETFVTLGSGRGDISGAREDGRVTVEGDGGLGDAFLAALPRLA